MEMAKIILRVFVGVIVGIIVFEVGRLCGYFLWHYLWDLYFKPTDYAYGFGSPVGIIIIAFLEGLIVGLII